jgi:predicted kinase
LARRAPGVQNDAVKQPRLYLLCGLPGAGKTTRAQQIVGAVSGLHLSADEWIQGLGVSLVDFEFRVRLQDVLLEHAGRLLRCGLKVVIEFGSWHRAERERIRQVARGAGAAAELHYLNAPLDELVRRVRQRGGPYAEPLASEVLMQQSGRFEQPTPEEIALFDRYCGPGDRWNPE